MKILFPAVFSSKFAGVSSIADVPTAHAVMNKPSFDTIIVMQPNARQQVVKKKQIRVNPIGEF